MEIGSSLGRGVFNLEKALNLGLGDLTPTPFEERTKPDIAKVKGPPKATAKKKN